MISLNYQNHESAMPGSYDPSKIPASTPSYHNFNQQKADQKSPSTFIYCPMLSNSTVLTSPTPTGLSLRNKGNFNDSANKLRYSHSPDSPPPTPTVKSELSRASTSSQPFTHFYSPNTTSVKAQSQWERPNLYHPQIVQYHHYPQTPQTPILQQSQPPLQATTNSGYFNQFNEPINITVKITNMLNLN